MNSRPRANKFEIIVTLVLFAPALMFIGAATGFMYRLIVVGWRVADFLFKIIFAPS